MAKKNAKTLNKLSEIDQPKITALIPLRGGSKSIPYKNIKVIAGKPLCYWVCNSAVRSKYITDVTVSTEDNKIKQVVESFGMKIKVVDRPMELAQDLSSTESVMLDLASQIGNNFDVLVTIQATSPYTTSRDLDSAIEQFLNNNHDSMLTAVKTKRFFWAKEGKPLNYDHMNRPMRQNFDGVFMENGAFYITKKEILLNHKNRLGGNIGIYEMPDHKGAELDEQEDWDEIEKLLAKSNDFLFEQIKNIKMIVTDFDGVWTNNKVKTNKKGHEAVECSKEDSLGLSVLRKKNDIPVIVLSSEKNDSIAKRCKKLKLPLYISQDKEKTLEKIIIKNKISWKNVCYAGNDINDIECMMRAGMSFCPSDANEEIRGRSNYISSKPGGNGALRELFDLFTSAINFKPRTKHE